MINILLIIIIIILLIVYFIFYYYKNNKIDFRFNKNYNYNNKDINSLLFHIDINNNNNNNLLFPLVISNTTTGGVTLTKKGIISSTYYTLIVNNNLEINNNLQMFLNNITHSFIIFELSPIDLFNFNDSEINLIINFDNQNILNIINKNKNWFINNKIILSNKTYLLEYFNNLNNFILNINKLKFIEFFIELYSDFLIIKELRIYNYTQDKNIRNELINKWNINNDNIIINY